MTIYCEMNHTYSNMVNRREVGQSPIASLLLFDKEKTRFGRRMKK